MAHNSQLQFIRLLSEGFPKQFKNRRVLEVGSLDINGSIRRFFPECEYVGLDVASGPAVDIVCEGQKYDAPDESFDVVISCEAMEHNPYWAETLQNMIRLCRPGGIVVMTCATIGRPEHGTTRSEPESSPLTVGMGWNYYRNLAERHFRKRVDFSGLGAHRFWTRWHHYDLFFLGVKGQEVGAEWELTTRAVTTWIAQDSDLRALRYRGLMAKYAGDVWFGLMHRLTHKMARASARMERLHGLRS